MADNWYIVLELPFDPTPEHDERVIAKQIEEKRAFWSRRFNDPNMGAAYHRYLDKVHDGTIARDMIGPNNKRKQLIKEACEITYGPIDETLRLTGLGGKVTENELQRITDHHRVNIDVVRRRALALGIQIGEEKQENYLALYHKHYSHKPDNTASFDQMSQYLVFFSVENLYEFLSDNTPDAGLKRSSCDDLRKRAEEKRKKEFYRNDARSTAGQRLCGYCESAFKDTRSKAVYDSYLLYTRTKTLLDRVKSQYTISGRLSEELSEKFAVDLAEVLKDRKLATEVLVAFCEVERIPYTLPINSPSSNSPSGDSSAGSSPTGSFLPRSSPEGGSPTGRSPTDSSPPGSSPPGSSSAESSPEGGTPSRSSPSGSSPSGGSTSGSSPAGSSSPSGSSSLVYIIPILAACILAIIFFVPLINDDSKDSGVEQTPTQATKQTVEITEKVGDPGDLATAKDFNKRASDLYSQGRYSEAEPLFKRALEIAETVLDPQDPDIATFLNNLANTLDKQGRYSETERLYRKALAIREKVLGPQHPDTARTLHDLAVCVNNRGNRYGEAEELHRRALAIREQVLGPEHLDTAQSLNGLANNLESQRRYSEAEPLYRGALEIREAILGPKHVTTAKSVNDLASNLGKQGRYPKAEELLERYQK